MGLFLLAATVLVLGGGAALLAGRSRWASVIGPGSAVVGCVMGLVPAVHALGGGTAAVLRLPWGLPGAEFHVGLDALSGFFLIPTLGVSALAAVWGSEYLRPYRDRKNLGFYWLCFNLLVAGMALVLVARNAVLFLVAWEVMSLASFFLVGFENEKAEVREAAWIYLVATHLGTAFLLVMFLLLGRESGSYDFGGFAAIGAGSGIIGVAFVLAVIGFGTKAGFMPFHVWLPEAHPAAPSHVSAVMSGVMIKTGIYGIVRVLTFLGPPPLWWGWLLVGIGLVSGVLGVLFALAQHDLKRLLAYHSVENIGIITAGLGLGLIGVSTGSATLTVLGFGGGLLHVLNHAMFKALLFLGAGTVAHETGTRDMEHLGGLMKRMPWTGATFLVGAAAICALPPLNGFVSEFLIYIGAFRSVSDPGAAGSALPAVATIAGLALIGGLAAACFAKAFGIVFLGEPRSEQAAHAHEPGIVMVLPMVLLALGCVTVGLMPSAVVHAMGPLLATVTGSSQAAVDAQLAEAGASLSWVALAGVVLLALVGGLILLRRALLSRRSVETTVTWDCGYARPTPRMQYTASSFAQPLTDLFHLFLQTRKRQSEAGGLFPRDGAFASETPDVCRERGYGPIFAAVTGVLGRLRFLQSGRIQIYVLYIALALLALLVWKLGLQP